MISRGLHNFCFLMVALTAAILGLFGSATSFVADDRITKGRFPRRPPTDRAGNAFSSSLSAGGFGKTPTGKSQSSKKKTTKKKRNKSPSVTTLDYIPYDSEPESFRGSGSQQEATRALLEWLDEEEVEGLEGVEIGFSKSDSFDSNDGTPGLRGVFAKQNFQAGEYLMAVPFVTTLLVDEDYEPSTTDPDTVVLRSDEPDLGFRFWEKFFCLDDEDDGNGEKYDAFLDCLPMTPDDPNFDGTPDFWSEEDIHRLEIPSVVDNLLARKKTIARLAERLLEDIVVDEEGNNNDDEDGDDMDLASNALSTIQQCCWLVQSRAFTTYKKAMSIDGAIGLLSRVVLIPFIDMINHASPKLANAEMQVVETKEYDESFYALIATQPIRKGTEIKICYGTGKETSLEIFSKYGFWPEVENREREKVALQRLLEGMEWNTTLEEDQAMLKTEDGSREPMRTILSIRIYAKSYVV